MTDEIIEKLARIPQFYFVKLNHAKDKIGFYWDKTGRVEFYVMDIETKEYEQISKGQVPRAVRSGYVWTRDDKGIIFAKDIEGNEQHNLYYLDIETKEVKQLTDTPKYQEHAEDTSPDGKYLLFRSTRNGQMNLFTYNLRTEETNELTNFSKPVMGGIWSPNNEYIVFGYNDTDNMQNVDIWIMDPDGSNQHKLLSMKEGSRESVAKISEDGKLLIMSSDFEGNSQAGVYNLETKENLWFGKEKTEEYGATITEDNKQIVAIRNYKATISPIIYDIKTGKEQELKVPPGIASGSQLTKNDRYLLMTLNSSTSPSSLIKYNLRNDKVEELIPVDLNDIDPEFLVEDKYIEYPSTDGLEIGAILYRPQNIEDGEKLPALVDVHGGPSGQYFRSFSMFSQILVNNGYVILKPNFRGSTGYGRKFQDMNIKDIGGGDLEDVIAGAKYLRSLEYVDPERIGIFGGSYGGYMTFLATVKKPDLWKVGAAAVGITDWLHLYKESMPHFKYYLHQLFGKPEEEEELYKERSPLNYAENLKCPLLIVHGANDPRCPISQAERYKNRLEKLGWEEGKEGQKTFEYNVFTDIGHGGYSDPEFRIRSFEVMLDFFNRRL